MTDRVGQHFGNYRLVALLGQGGYAEVYLGQHVRLELQAAIKVLHTHLTDQEAEHFEQEAETIARLAHPSIVRILDYDVQAGVPFLVMEYAPNGSLRRRYPKGRVLPLPQIVSYVKQVAAALQYAHDQKIIHRDIKPENMLLGRRQEVLLSDFGLAALAHSSASFSTQAAVGTLAYMAPEQIEGHPRAASDQYALGGVVYEWLCGSRPFEGSMTEIMVQHLTMPPAPMHEKVVTIPLGIEQVVLRALAKDPKARFACVHDFATALEQAESRAPSQAELLPDYATVAVTGNQPPQQPASEPQAEARHLPFNNLPAQLTALIGREQEIQAVCALMRQPEVRLVTLTGPGGVGKTRLGLQVATYLLENFADGVYFVSLAPLSQPDLVLPTLAQTLNLKETSDWLPLEHLKTYLHEKQLLLLLDNFEQVIAAAPLLVALLHACPALKMLVTSRARLRVSGEFEFPVPPLALPDLQHLPEHATLLEYAAVALLLQRAQALKPDFLLTADNARDIAEICLRLDGLPLAIELAAARLKLLSPQTLLARLSHRLQVLTAGVQDAPARQQTLRNTIQWSYDLLTAEEQRLFCRLCVFVAGCTLEAVEAVCVALPDGVGQVLEDVTSLLDKSLLQQSEHKGGESRLSMLETLREYGLECLRESAEAEAVQRAHADYYLRLAEEAVPRLKGAEQLVWLANLSREQENLRAALGWLIAYGEGELALRLSAALWWFWFMLGDWSEGRRWLEAALQLPSAQGPTAARARALSGAGELAWSLGDYPAAQHLLSESVTLSRELGDERGLASSLGILGLVLQEQGELTAGRSRIEEGLALCRQLDRIWDLARLLLNTGLTVRRQGNYPQAAALYQEGLTLARALGDRYLIAYGLTYSGGVAIYQGDLVQTAAVMQEGLKLARELGDKRFITDGLGNLGYIAFLQGDLVQAAALTQEGLTMARELGHKPSLAYHLNTLAKIVHAQGAARQAAALYQEGLSVSQELGYIVLVGYHLIGLAEVAETQGQFTQAAWLLGAAEALIDVKKHLAPVERVAYERDVAHLRARLGEESFATAWKEGRSMNPQQALAAPERAVFPEPVPAVPQPLPGGKPPTTRRPVYPAGLTAREMEVLRLLAQGMTSQQIAERLILSLHTVNAHVRSIYTKLELNSRSALTRYAIEQHLL